MERCCDLKRTILSMNENDFNSGQGPQGQDEPLSATAMFLRSFDSAPAPSKETAPASEVNPASPVGVLSSPDFGKSIALAGGPFSSAAANRKIELQAMFSF